jgi:hypothetical protein
VGKFGSCLELKIHGERGCVPGSNVLFEIFQGTHVFCCWVNLCCNCRILEVPTSRFLVQPMLEALEGSGKA